MVVKNCLGNPTCLPEQPEGFGIFSQTEKTVKRPSVTLHSRKFKLWVFYMFGSGPVRNMFEYIATPFVLKRSWDSTPMGPLYQWNLQCTNALFQKTPSPCSNKFPFSLNKNVWKNGGLPCFCFSARSINCATETHKRYNSSRRITTYQFCSMRDGNEETTGDINSCTFKK